MSPKLIKFLKRPIIELLIGCIIFSPILAILQIPFVILIFKVSDIALALAVAVSAILMTAFIVFPFLDKVYRETFNILEKDQSTKFFKAVKLSIKRAFCSHSGREARYEAHPQPLIYFEILEAKCSDCGIENYEMRKWADNQYKIDLAWEVLYQQNKEKFHEYWKQQAEIQQQTKH